MSGLNRRMFTLGAGAALVTLPAARAWAQSPVETRSISNWIGDYDIPANPQRVIAIDERIDLETALALKLPVIGYSHAPMNPWVAVETDAEFIGAPPNIEQILGMEPDLILCSDWGDSEGWPLQRLRSVAPVLPLDASIGWRANLENISGWLGMEGRADAAVADFDAYVAGIRARHESIAKSKVIALHYLPGEGEMKIRGQGSNHADVLKDLGGHTIDPSIIEEGNVSMELLP
ncbi:ABC transporter substrate-binding protein [Devosia sp. 2618]|uniref:ABC transporter substrate-binding protein n=1 Tax=Devosia sp. 2618 TaxID=3156454 RepID=UPI003394B199